MAAERVVRENLERTLCDPEVPLLLSLKLKNACDKLGNLVRSSGEAMLDREGLWMTSQDHPESNESTMGDRLENLSSLILEADDLLDQILALEQRIRLCRGQRGGKHRNQLVRQLSHVMARSPLEVRLFISSSNQLIFPMKMAWEVKKISKKIENKHCELSIDPNNPTQHVERKFQHTKWAITAEQRVIGRENDKEKIVNMLLQPPENSMSKVSVIHMSGLPGVGKSALAKDIYEDDKVKSHFDLRMWIPVSHINDDTAIIREIVESCTNRRSNYSDNSQSPHYHNSRVDQNDMNSFRDLLGCRSSSVSTISPNYNASAASQNEINIYARRLRKEIKGKLYLLVLDDVCLEKWQSLRSLLAEGGKGSQILVTTRLTKGPDLVNDESLEVQAYTLQGLKEEHSWTLFKTLAFDHVEPCDPEMQTIGLEIADLCKHLPLTIKIAARYLHGRDRNGSILAEWLAFRDRLRLIRDQQKDVIRDQQEDVIVHVLRITCSDLPTRLRACFGYCSLFPDDFTFNKHDLISLWIAQGFVSLQDGQTLDEVVDHPRDGQSVEEGVVNPQNVQSEEEGVVGPQNGQSEEERVVNPRNGQSVEEGVVNPRNVQSEEEGVASPHNGQSEEQRVVNPRNGHGQSVEKGVVNPQNVQREEEGVVGPQNGQSEEEKVLSPHNGQSVEEGVVNPWNVQIEEEGVVGPQNSQSEEERVVRPRNGQSVEEGVVNPQNVQREEEGVVGPQNGQSAEERVVSPHNGQSVEEGVVNPQNVQSEEEGVVGPKNGQSGEEGSANQHDGQSLAKIGEKYFLELLRRCLFEEVSYDELGNILSCKMHPIVCRRASELTMGVANIHMTDSCMIQVPDPTSKHVSVNCRGYSSLKFSSSLNKSQSIRTLIFVKEPDCNIKVDSLECSQLISSYKRLRVLDLRDLGIKALPDSLCDQIHLRYLDLSMNDGLVALPKSFTRLYNLQTLKLNSCSKLKRLATDFGLLSNLKRFEVDGCDSLTCMPLDLGKLTQLETLSRFVVGKGSYKWTAYVALRELSGLKMLRGRLTIEFTGDWLPNILETIPAVSAGDRMKNKSKLNEVKIRWAQRTSNIAVKSDKEASAQQRILEHLQPNSDLKILCIEGYKGKHFPSWANIDTIDSSLPKLVIISIEGCGECKSLPPFGKLEHLRKLTLRHMTNVQYFESPPGESEKVIEERPLFKSLQELTLHNFFKLEGWRRDVADFQQAKTLSFPCLSKLRIWNCPNLRSLPSFPKVTDLKLRNVNQLLLDDCAKKAPSIENKIETISLQVKGCPDLKDFEVVIDGLRGLPSLKSLVIEKCDSLSSLASDLKNLTSLERLRISSCKALDLSKNTGYTYTFPFSPWQKLKFLRELTLVEIPKMETLPEGLKHVTTLKLLWISSCQSLGSLPEWISSLTALQHLRIESCRALKRLPEELKDVKSLLKVEITECPELMERCREHKGEDWPYIGHARVLLHKSWRYGYVS